MSDVCRPRAARMVFIALISHRLWGRWTDCERLTQRCIVRNIYKASLLTMALEFFMI
jgi:hypothetical protein